MTLSSQGSAKPLEPVLSFGTSVELTAAVQKVAKLTEAGNFTEAKAALRLLPSKKIKVAWDDSGIPDASRFDFNQQEEAVLGEWKNSVSLSSFELVRTGADIQVSFVQGTGLSLVWSDDPNQPRLAAKIGIRQGTGVVDPAAVHNEFSYSVGSFFGITRLPLNGLVMAGAEAATQALGPNPIEIGIAVSDLVTCLKIRDQVMESGVVKSGSPIVQDEPVAIDFGTVIQGTTVSSAIPIKNSGGGVLMVQVMPDCSCFGRTGPVAVKPTGYQAPVQMDTREFTGIVQGGVLHHNLFLLSNDASKPVRIIPVRVKVTPRFRFLPDRHFVIANEHGVTTVQAYLYFPADHPILVTNAESSGLPGEVSFEPWEGMMADPDLGEGPLHRKGYKFTLKLKEVPDGAQVGTNISVNTDDPHFDPITYLVMVQKGILAAPQSLFMGEVGGATRSMYFMLTRPGKPFKITELTTDSPHFKATAAPTQNDGEYKVSVVYDGKAAKGDLHATVIVKTNDPKQAEIDVPILGTVR